MSANLERVVDETSLAIQRLEARQLTALRSYLEESHRRLQADLRRAWPAVLDETATAGRIVREARARALLLQVDTALDALRLGPTTGVPEITRNMVVLGRTAEAEQTRALLGELARAARGTVALPELEALVRMSTAVNMAAVEAQIANATARLHRYTTGAIDRVNQAVVDGVVRGSGWRPVSTEIRDAIVGDPAAGTLKRTGVDSLGRVRSDLLVKGRGGLAFQAETIARTELVSSLQDARDERYRAAGIDTVIWYATQDERTCAFCGARSGRIYKLEDVVIPAHPRCVVGDTLVLAQGVSGHSKRWYEGPLVTISTRRGHDLTVTPNHPVLTNRGWVPAGDLEEGDHVVSAAATEWPGAGRVHDDDVVGRAEEVINARIKSGSVATYPVPVAPEDFHGDGAGSQVAYVGADGLLRGHVDAALRKELVHAGLVSTIESALGGATRRYPRSLLSADLPTARGLVGLAYLAGALRLGHLGPLDRFGFRLCPRCDPQGAEVAVDDVSGDTVVAGHSVGAVTPLEPGQQILGGEVDPIVRDAQAALPFGVAFDSVGRVERVGSWSGHVYNLQTAAGWYVADGIITHNCRCVASPIKREWVDLGIIDTADLDRHRSEVLREFRAVNGSDARFATGPSPFEKAAGMKSAPSPVSL